MTTPCDNGDSRQLELDVHSYSKDLMNQLSHDTPDDRHSALVALHCLIGSGSGTCRYKGPELCDAREIFISSSYERVATCMLELISVEWWQCMSDECKILFDQYFTHGVPHLTLTVLISAIRKYSMSFRLTKCVSLLESFIKNDRLLKCMEKESGRVVKRGMEGEMGRRWERTVGDICSLPDHLANRLQTDNSATFVPANYIPSLGDHMLTVLTSMCERLRQGKDINVQFIGLLVAKLSMLGYSDLFWPSLISHLEQLVTSDFLWSRVVFRLISSVPDRCLESVILPVLSYSSSFHVVERLLGDIVMDNKKAEYLMCTKIALLRFSDKVLLLQNMIGYLASSATRQHLFIMLLGRLLEVWSDQSALRHTSHTQHLYISKAIVISLAFVKQFNIKLNKQDLLHKLMPGVQHHLGCSEVKVRSVGMCVAQECIRVIDPGGPQLNFEYEEDEDTKHLLSLLVVPQRSDIHTTTTKLEAVSLDDQDDDVTSVDRGRTNSQLCGTTELDSDDDLEPYDMSHDHKTPAQQSPHYIRDCIEGLICNDDADRVEACLTVCEALIRAQPHGLTEIAEEFAKVLLHLSDEFSYPKFTQQRMGAMVALTVVSPIQVASYFTGEFYKRNYNVRQRLDMLEAVAKAAQELTSIDKAPTTPKIQEITSQDVTATPDTWQEVVARRIEGKTRRFHTPTSPAPLSPNKFAPVAGYFLFPLIANYDSTDAHCHLLGEDSLLLCRLVSTTGVIMHAATNAPIAPQMATAMFDFLWMLRYHKDRCEYFGVYPLLYPNDTNLVTLGHVPEFTASLSHYGMGRASRRLRKVSTEDIVEKDPSDECKKCAIQLMCVLQDALSQGSSIAEENPELDTHRVWPRRFTSERKY